MPLLDEAAWGDDQDALGIGAHQQLADKQPGHDGLASARIVSQHISQGLAQQHGLVDGRNLMRQRLHVRRVDRHHRVEQMRQRDTVGLGRQFERHPRRIKGPRPPGFGERQGRLVGAEQHPFQQATIRRLVVHSQSVVAHKFRGHHAHYLARLNPSQCGVLRDLLQFQHGGYLLSKDTAYTRHRVV